MAEPVRGAQTDRPGGAEAAADRAPGQYQFGATPTPTPSPPSPHGTDATTTRDTHSRIHDNGQPNTDYTINDAYQSHCRRGRPRRLHRLARQRMPHAKREAHPGTVEQAHADFAAPQAGEVSAPRLALLDRMSPDYRELLVTW